MSPYQHLVPNYERNFYEEKMLLVKDRMSKMFTKLQELGAIKEDESMEKAGKFKAGTTRSKLQEAGL